MTTRRPTLASVARDLPATPEGCQRVLAALREHGRPMSLSLLTSRVPPLPARLVAACLLDLIVEQEEVSINDLNQFELEIR